MIKNKDLKGRKKSLKIAYVKITHINAVEKDKSGIALFRFYIYCDVKMLWIASSTLEEKTAEKYLYWGFT